MRVPVEEQSDADRRSAGAGRDWTAAEIEQAVRAVDATVFFVSPRVLRRVIEQDCRLIGFALRVPHRKSYAIDAAALLEIVDRDELSPNESPELPSRVILLPRPDARKAERTAAGPLLAHYWRLLFHIRVHAAVEAALHGRSAANPLFGTKRPFARRNLAATMGSSAAATPVEPSSALARERTEQIGPAAFEEIRRVLYQENFLLPPANDWSCYVEFAAVYLELRWFAPSFLPRYFPGLDDPAAIEAVLAQDVDADDLLQATRPPGADEPVDRCEIDHVADSAAETDAPAPPFAASSEPSPTKCRALMQRARRPASLGNTVRAALDRVRAQQCAPADMVGPVRDALRMDLYRLVRRLQAALELGDSDPQPWQDLLLVLARQTSQSFRTPESRLLYDLQKVCVDHEREIYTIDVVEWAISFGRRPVKRPLPHQRDVLMLRHLRSAARRLAVVRLSESQREQLAVLLRGATERVEARLRDQVRPVLSATLDEVGLQPRNTPEIVARKKLIEELLDQIVDRGFFTMGILRDAISRNNLKLPDISGAGDFFRGDQLLRADRRLAVALDGVYHAGESYLRGMQRFSSLAFGTGVGRFLTRFAAVPFGGAYVALAGLRELAEIVGGLRAPPSDGAIESARGALGESAWLSAHFSFPVMVVALGLFLLGLVNSARFRGAVAASFHTGYRVLRLVMVEPIRWIIRSELLQRVLHSRLFRMSIRFLVKPLLWTLVLYVLLPWEQSNWHVLVGEAAGIFVGVNLLLNSRPGRAVEEVLADWLVRIWRRFGLRIIIGLFGLVVDVFRWLLDAVEWFLYTVDEWLRFRSGQSAVVLVIKGVLGTVWFFVAYVVRFSVNLLIEPQINPIKHFPVVTVSHKLLWPLVPSLARLLELTMSKAWAWALAPTVITCIPGIFGFLVWELKENWRLYAANRRKQLGPVSIGSHGETMSRFFKPGLHSGTVPKRFAKLRRAERRARKGGSWRAARKHLHVLHHVETAIRRHVERDFDQLFKESASWQGPTVSLQQVRLGATGVELTFPAGTASQRPLQIVIAIQAGWLVADVVCPGWTGDLLPRQREVLTAALFGLYKSAGVELVRQQLAGAFDPHVPAFAITHGGLAVWPEREPSVEVFYDLRDGEWVAPQAVLGLAGRGLPTLGRRQLVFGEVEMTWEQWVDMWQNESADRAQEQGSEIPVRLLP